MNRTSLSNLYNMLSGTKWEYLHRGHKSSVLTIPSVQPLYKTPRHRLPQNYQSVGSRGVNNITSKLLLTLFPPTLPFMRLELSPYESQKLANELTAEFGGEEAAKVLAEIEVSLGAVERQAASEFETSGMRPAIAELFRLLVVTGNGLFFDRAQNLRPIVCDLRDFVVDRDPDGSLQTVVLQQQIARAEAVRILNRKLTGGEEGPAGGTDLAYGDTQTPSISLYTGAVRVGSDAFEMWQEIDGDIVPDSMGIYSEDDLPIRPLMFQKISGSSYGRGFVEDLDGDLLALESLSRVLVEGSAAMAKVLWLVRPGGSTRQATLAQAPNGAIKTGNVEDVGAVQANKSSDLGVAFSLRQELTVSLSRSFLLNSSVQRQGERVTAEEIRFVSQELEDALGSVYSSLAVTVQRPLVMYLFNRLKADGKVDGLPKQVRPVIATGIEAISRGHKVTRIHQFVQILQGLVGPEGTEALLRTGVIARDLASGLSLDARRYVKSDEEIAEQQQQQQAAQAVETLGPETIRAASQQPQAQ